MDRCILKVSELRARFPDKDIEVDGGVSPKNIDTCADAGNSNSPSRPPHTPCLINGHAQAAMSSLLGQPFSARRTLRRSSPPSSLQSTRHKPR